MARVKRIQKRAAPTTSKPLLLRFKFDDFENLPSGSSVATKSGEVHDKDGYVWRLSLFPGGRDTSGSDVDDDDDIYEPVEALGSTVDDGFLGLLESGDEADVTFNVGGTLISAHKLILKLNAPVLHSFCDEHEDGLPIPINDATPEVFRLLLSFIYGGDASAIIDWLNKGWVEDDECGKEFIEIANRYGVVSLKLLVEKLVVEKHLVCVENVVDWLLFADAKTCPLLKEHATNYCSVMMKDILNHESSTKLTESPKLLSELMVAFSSTEPDDRFGETSMTVSELRDKLEEKGLDLDGSREMLVSRLNAANKRQRIFFRP
ncbi:hypothetical protein ACHAXT_001353 [Thalassiosira profunda]